MKNAKQQSQKGASGRIKVTVTALDIAEGTASLTGCPIARALNRTAGGRWTVYPDVAMGKSGAYWMPWNARLFVDRFDDGDPVEPIEFEIVAFGPRTTDH